MVVNANKYNLSLRVMHWVMAALILGMIAVGWYMAELPKEEPLKNILVGWHKSFGALLLILFFVRVALHFTTNIPPLPDTMPRIERMLAHAGHGALYILIGIVPLSGYAMSNLYGYGVGMFGIPMPKLFADNKELGHFAHETHEILPFILLGMVALHVGAVIKHRFFDRPENDVLGRML